MILSFPKMVKDLVASLPKNDYPVLNTRLFFECWISYVIDKSLMSMKDLFKQLNETECAINILTFAKASQQRSQKAFLQIYEKLKKRVQYQKSQNKYVICPIDSNHYYSEK